MIRRFLAACALASSMGCGGGHSSDGVDGSAGASAGTGGIDQSGGSGGGTRAREPELLAEAISAVELALDGEWIYAADPAVEKVWRVRRMGGMPAATVGGAEGRVVGLFSHASGVFWLNAGSPQFRATGIIKRLRPGETKAEVFADRLDWPTSLVADEGFAYWTAYAAIMKAPVTDGGAPEPMAKVNAPFYIVQDADTLYWVDRGTANALFEDGQIMAMPKAGGTPREVAIGQPSPSDLATAGDFLYWATEGPIGETYGGSIRAKAKHGAGTTGVLATKQVRPSGLVVDARYVYWVSGRSVRRVPREGGPSVDLATFDVLLRTMTADDQWLYVAGDGEREGSAGRRIWRIAR